VARRKSIDPAPYSCANCKHQHDIDPQFGVAECRRFPMVYVDTIDRWVSPPAPDTFLCGEHILKCNS